jgi:hypothetical protein
MAPSASGRSDERRAFRESAASAVPTEDIFRERAEARAILSAACIYDLREAVHVLQADAVRTDLVAEIGEAFAEVRP